MCSSSTTDRTQSADTPTDTLFLSSVDRSAFRPATRSLSLRRRPSLGLKPFTRSTPRAFRLSLRRRWQAGLDTWSCCAAARRTGSSRCLASLPAVSSPRRTRRAEQREETHGRTEHSNETFEDFYEEVKLRRKSFSQPWTSSDPGRTLVLFSERTGHCTWRWGMDKRDGHMVTTHMEKREPRAAQGIAREKRCGTLSASLSEHNLASVHGIFRGIDLDNRVSTLGILQN